MKRHFALITLLVLTLPVVAALAGQGEAKKKTIVGELVDSKCYLAMGARGEGHRACAVKCAKMGIPVAIADAKGNTYTIALPAPALAQYQGLQARVTGKVFETSRTIIPMKIEVKKDGRWTEVELPKTMM